MTLARKNIQYLISFIGLAMLFSCQSVDIMTNLAESERSSDFSAPADSLWLVAYIKHAGTDSIERLLAYSSGFVQVFNHPAYLEKWCTFSPDRMREFKDRVASAIDWANPAAEGVTINPLGCYEISYEYVKRDDNSIRAGLSQDLIGLVDSTIEDIINDELSINLMVSPSTQNSVKGYLLSLEMRNLSSNHIFLQFPPDLGIEFLIYDQVDVFNTTPARRFSIMPPIANSSNAGLLRPGQPISFAVFWDGKDENAAALKGKVTIIGRLHAMPGGVPPPQSIQMENNT